MNPPEVVYPFVEIPGRPVSFSSIERTIFITSLVFSRLHYRRVTVLATAKWLRYIQDDAMLSRLITNFGEIGDESIAAYPRDIFWSTIAKMVACQVHLDLSPGTPLLLMDADAIIFDPTGVINWTNPDQGFAAGYLEPDSWEVYVEGNVRMRGCLAHALLMCSESREAVNSSLACRPRPVNAGCLYFNNEKLLKAYATGLREFMGYFAKNVSPKQYFTDPAHPAKGVTYFSEVMLADQQLLAYLLVLTGCSFRDIRYFTTFETTWEYPASASDFVHFWKLKGWLNSDQRLASVVEQLLLHRLFEVQKRHPHFLKDLCTVVHTNVPMLDVPYYKLA